MQKTTLHVPNLYGQDTFTASMCSKSFVVHTLFKIWNYPYKFWAEKTLFFSLWATWWMLFAHFVCVHGQLIINFIRKIRQPTNRICVLHFLFSWQSAKIIRCCFVFSFNVNNLSNLQIPVAALRSDVFLCACVCVCCLVLKNSFHSNQRFKFRC